MSDLTVSEKQRALLVQELNRTLPLLHDHKTATDLMRISGEQNEYSYSYERQNIFARKNEEQILNSIVKTLSGEAVNVDDKGPFTLKIEQMLADGASPDELALAFIEANALMIAKFKELLANDSMKEFQPASIFFQSFLETVQHQREAMVEIRDRSRMEKAHNALESLIPLQGADKGSEDLISSEPEPASEEGEVIHGEILPPLAVEEAAEVPKAQEIIDAIDNAPASLDEPSAADDDQSKPEAGPDAPTADAVQTDDVSEEQKPESLPDAPEISNEPEAGIAPAETVPVEAAPVETDPAEIVPAAKVEAAPAARHLEIEEIAKAPEWADVDTGQLNDAPDKSEPYFQVSLDNRAQAEPAAVSSAVIEPVTELVEAPEIEPEVEDDLSNGYVDTKGRRILLVKRAG